MEEAIRYKDSYNRDYDENVRSLHQDHVPILGGEGRRGSGQGLLPRKADTWSGSLQPPGISQGRAF